MKLWQRYIFKELFKVFLFFLFSFYILYVVIDYSTHFQEFLHGKQIPLFKIFQYYLFQFIKRADILLPLGVLVAAIKVLCQMNSSKESLALQVAGIKQQALLAPFFALGLAATLGCLSLNEFAIPHSLNFIDRFYEAHLSRSFKGKHKNPMRIAHLDDYTKVVYQYYDINKDALFDVFWFKSSDDIWRIKHLYQNQTPPVGEWVDHIIRNEEGLLEKVDSFPTFKFETLSWISTLPKAGFFPHENRSMSELKRLLQKPLFTSSFERAEVLTQYLFKWVMPFLNILVLIAIIPSCIKQRRAIPQFFIYALSVFSLLGFIALIDAAVILGENATLSPYLALITPFAVLFTIFLIPFYRHVS